MEFDKVYSILVEELSQFKEPTIRKKRHLNASTGTDRLHQNFVPDIYKTDSTANGKIEILRDKPNGSETCDINDLIYIINNYIKQGDQQPCDHNNVWEMAKKYLTGDRGKNLGTTGISVHLDPITNLFKMTKR
tara:strand:+ start:1104 stop:1502 length:399 start_codon:yes stop_codon:yes gene_type:complete